MQIGNVHLARGFMIVTGKGDKQRFVPLGELSKISLATYIRKYRNEAKESEPVFVNRFGEKCTINTVKQVFQKLKKQTGILRLHAHLLRHTFATRSSIEESTPSQRKNAPRFSRYHISVLGLLLRNNCSSTNISNASVTFIINLS